MHKFRLALFFLLGSSCHYENRTNKIAIPNFIPPPPPNFIPPNPAPSFSPNILNAGEVQINRLPHPFNLNGRIPYAIWVDGKRVNLNPTQIKVLAQSLNLKFSQPLNTANIHNGEGWVFPYQLNENGKQNLNNRKYGQKKATP